MNESGQAEGPTRYAGTSATVQTDLGAVQVRRIPSQVLKSIKQRIRRRDGTVDQAKFLALTLAYGCVDPGFTESEARRVIHRHSARRINPVVDRIMAISEITDVGIENEDELTPTMRDQVRSVARVIAWASTSSAPPQSSAGHGRESRPATNVRRKGSKRTNGSGSSSSGEDSDPSCTTRACARADCEINVERTGTRGPLPKLCPAHRVEQRRTKARARQRKRRGAQHVLLRFESLNADGELRAYSIVDVDLGRERPPEDADGRWRDVRATYWITGTAPNASPDPDDPPEPIASPTASSIALAIVEDAAMRRASRDKRLGGAA